MANLFGQSEFRQAFGSSVVTLVVGSVITVVLGGVTGLIMGISRLANYALKYYVDAILITPTIALAPIFVILFGITSTNVLVLTVLYGYAIIAISTAVAVRGVDSTLLEVGRVYGAGRVRLIAGLLIPAAMPSLFGGLHLGVTRAFKGMVVGQVFLGVLGVGGFVARYSQAFDAAGVWCIAIVLIALALVVTWFVKAADHVINYWAYRV